MALWSVVPARTRETAFASWRSDLRGMDSGFVCGDGADGPRFASYTGTVALRTKGVSTCLLTIRSRRFERRGSPPSVSRGFRVRAGGPSLYSKHASGLTWMTLSLLL